MYQMITIILLLGLSSLSNARFFGIFGSNTTPKPDVVVSESPKSETDKAAYENFLRTLSSTYPPHTTVKYIPVYIVQPQKVEYIRPQYTEYVQPQYTGYIQPQYTEYTQPISSYIYPGVSVQNIKSQTTPVQVEPHQPLYTSSFNDKFQKPITVLDPPLIKDISENIYKVTTNLDKLIESSDKSVDTKVKTVEYHIPESPMPRSLYDLPVSGIAPDFRTGGYVTKSITLPSMENKGRSGRKFSHSYSTGDGTKVSEEGELIKAGNGEETVIKRGQYEYIDASGKPIIVKWIADDGGFRVVN